MSGELRDGFVTTAKIGAVVLGVLLAMVALAVLLGLVTS